MGNCVQQCRHRDEHILADHDLVMEESCSSPRVPELLSLESGVITARTNGLHNRLNKSRACHTNKFWADRIRSYRIRPPSIPSRVVATNSDANIGETRSLKEPSSGKSEERPVSPATQEADESKGYPKELPDTKSHVPQTAREPKHSTFHDYGTTIFSALKPQILRALSKSKEREKERERREEEEAKVARAISFDSSSLVVEKRGAIADTYQVLGMLGKGAFGEVHKVRHRVTGKVYALKTISKSGCSEEVKNMVNEINVLKTLVPSQL